MLYNNLFFGLILFKIVVANYYKSPSYGSICNKTSLKITNKVPVHDLCYWNKIEWNNLKERSDKSDCNLHYPDANYIVERNIPTNIRLYKEKVYVIIDRSSGVPSTLNTFDLKDVKDKKCPKLNCFESCTRNQLADVEKCNDDFNYLINVRDISFQFKCEYAWIMDVGAYKKNGRTVIDRNPRICLYYLGNSEPSQSYCQSFDDKYSSAPLGLTSIVQYEPACFGIYAYMFNAQTGTIIVFKENGRRFYSIHASKFRAYPHDSLFNFYLNSYETYKTVVHQGIFSGANDQSGIFLSPKSSKKLFFISHKVLNNSENEHCAEFSLDIKDVGTFNKNGQTVGMVRDENILYFIQPQTNALVCANKKEYVDPEALQYLTVNACQFPHLTSVYLYKDAFKAKNVYMLTNNEPEIIVNGFDEKKKNFVITFVNTKEVEALYPECVSYFDYDSKNELAFALAKATKNEFYYEGAPVKQCHPDYQSSHNKLNMSHKMAPCDNAQQNSFNGYYTYSNNHNDRQYNNQPLVYTRK